MNMIDKATLSDHLWRPMTQHQTLRGVVPPRMTSAKGCFITNEHGNRLLDACAGLWCVNVGYGRTEIADVARNQMAELNYLNPMMTTEPVVALAEKIQGLLGFNCHVYFSSTGSEANETAFKIARQYHLQAGNGGERRYKIISRYRAYHGNTMGAMAATRHNLQLRDFHQRLIAAGKPKMVALIAVARKLLTILNAILRDKKTWQPA